jgi:hypothetical protein
VVLKCNAVLGPTGQSAVQGRWQVAGGRRHVKGDRWQVACDRWEVAGVIWQCISGRPVVLKCNPVLGPTGKSAKQGRWQVAGGEKLVSGDRWWGVGGQWQVGGGRWEVAGGRWQVEALWRLTCGAILFWY